MVEFYQEDIRFPFRAKMKTRRWYRLAALREGRRLGDVNVIFCSDPYLLGINRQYLGHDYYTDIITFDYCEGDLLSGDLFISVDTVRANAQTYGTSFLEELSRVMIHGLLHLVGYDDHSEAEIRQMRSKEDEYLSLLREL